MKPLLLLHGALGSADQMVFLKPFFSGFSDVYIPEFSGHGKSTYKDAFSMELFENDILNYMHKHKLNSAFVFGYSMGGYAALSLAMNHPEKLNGIVTLGTKWQWTPEIASREIKMLNPNTIAEKVPAFAEELKQRHTGQGWKKLLRNTAELMADLGNSGGLLAEDGAYTNIPVRIMLGSEDRMVSCEESEKMTVRLPNAEFKLLENQPHPIDKVEPVMLSEEIRNWMNQLTT